MNRRFHWRCFSNPISFSYTHNDGTINSTFFKPWLLSFLTFQHLFLNTTVIRGILHWPFHSVIKVGLKHIVHFRVSTLVRINWIWISPWVNQMEVWGFWYFVFKHLFSGFFMRRLMLSRRKIVVTGRIIFLEPGWWSSFSFCWLDCPIVILILIATF